MKKKLTNNINLKILSVILAAGLWFVVVTLADPNVTVTISDVPVIPQNDEFIENEMAYSIEKGYSKIKLYVTGSRSIVGKLDASDFTAIADFSNIQLWGEEQGIIPIQVTSNHAKISEDNIRTLPQNMRIKLEPRISEEYAIIADQGRARAATNYEVGKVTTNPQRVTISGPESIINIIDRVVAPISDSSIIQSKVYSNIILQVYDKNGAQFTESQMESLIFMDGDGNTIDAVVDMEVELWRVVEGVGFRIQEEGEPKEGYRFVEFTTAPKTVSVAGTENALNALEAAGKVIQINTPISLTDKEKSFDTTIDITSDLPEGTKLSGKQDPNIVVTASIEELNSQTVQIAKGDIIKIGADTDKYSYSIVSPEYLNIVVRGEEKDMPKLDTSKITASIDLSSCTEEMVYTVPVAVMIPAPFEKGNSEELTVSVKVKKIILETSIIGHIPIFKNRINDM